MVTHFFCLYARDHAMKYKQPALYKGTLYFSETLLIFCSLRNKYNFITFS